MNSIQQILIGMVHSEELADKERAMKEKLEALVAEIHGSGVDYAVAVKEFRKRFVLCVINHRTIRGNQCKAARELGMHRNTFSRTTRELNLGKGAHGCWGDKAEVAQPKPVQSAAMAAVGARQA